MDVLTLVFSPGGWLQMALLLSLGAIAIAIMIYSYRMASIAQAAAMVLSSVLIFTMLCAALMVISKNFDLARADGKHYNYEFLVCAWLSALLISSYGGIMLQQPLNWLLAKRPKRQQTLPC